MLYFILSLVTSTLGSLIGIGGGVILRPSLKLLGESAKSAAALSTFTVFIMAVISVYKYNKIKKAEQLETKTFNEKGITIKNSPSYNNKNKISNKKLIL